MRFPSPVRSWARGCALVAALGLLAVSPSRGEGRQVGIVVSRGGWIGFRYQIATVPSASGRAEPRIVITQVMDESPAQQAGFRPGDILLDINGREATPATFESVRSRLDPGDAVTLLVERRTGDNPIRLTMQLTAAAMPGPLELLELPRGFVLRVDSALQRLDSLQVHITASSVGGGVVVSGAVSSGVTLRESVGLRTGSADSLGVVVAPDATSTSWYTMFQVPRAEYRTIFPEPEAGKPFDFFVYENVALDSLRARLRSVEAAVAKARDEEETRRVALEREPNGNGRAMLEDQARRARTTRDRLEQEAQRIREVLGGGAGDPPSVLWKARQGDERVVTAEAEREGSTAERAQAVASAIRPLTAYIWGQNRVAGASITTLNPELAAYFKVSEGLLVTDVTPGTPAAEAGVRAGDVIRRVGGTPVATLDALRRVLLDQDRWPVTLLLVRRGEEMEVHLPR